MVSNKAIQSLLPRIDRMRRLVATLGSKSSLKRINRKQILDVNVAKACQTIVDPVAPMALRLQGNLLYVSTRVISQTTLTRCKVRSVARVFTTVWLCSLGRAKCAQRDEDDAADGQGPRARRECRQDLVGTLHIPSALLSPDV